MQNKLKVIVKIKKKKDSARISKGSNKNHVWGLIVMSSEFGFVKIDEKKGHVLKAMLLPVFHRFQKGSTKFMYGALLS